MEQHIHIDTHSIFRRLESAGFLREQSEAVVDVFSQLVLWNFATKQDLKEVDSRLSAQIKELDVRLTSQIKELETKMQASIYEAKYDLVKWMMGGFIATTGILTAVILKFVH